MQTVAEDIRLDILYEDGDILAINKPPGMVIHPAPGHSAGTVVNALLYHCPDLAGIGGIQRPGIVHRLDKDTSGVVIVAKNDAAHLELSRQFKERRISKHYLALVFGSPARNAGTVDLPLGRDPIDRKKMSIASPRGRAAVTIWQVAQRFSNATLLDVDLRTGRTHQIRVHCGAMGHPIIGDPVYGPGRRLQRLAQTEPPLHRLFSTVRRQMLHAARLELSHPTDGRKMVFEAPLPQDMRQLLEQMKSSLP
jgi:23S rRNA pseudouridine1911/1915/1917 synthase